MLLNEIDRGCERDYITGGQAILTDHILKTYMHSTYRIKATDEKKSAFYVSVCYGDSYLYLGILKKGNVAFGFFQTKGSKVSKEAPSFRGFDFIVQNYLNEDRPHPKLRLSHSGRCACCGRQLTEPESLRTGIGPVCRCRK